MAYNVARFEDPAEFGYNLVLNSQGQSVLTEPWYQEGINSIGYIPRNLNVMLFKTFDFQEQFPWFRPNWIGMSLDPHDADHAVAGSGARSEPVAHLRLALGRHRSGARHHPRWHRLVPVRLPSILDVAPTLWPMLGWVFRRGISKEARSRSSSACSSMRMASGRSRSSNSCRSRGRHPAARWTAGRSSTSTSTLLRGGRAARPPGAARQAGDRRRGPPSAGVVSAASYEARRFGVHSAMSLEAVRRCPHGVFLPVDGRRYQQASRDVMAVLRRFTPQVEPISIDEAFLDVTGRAALRRRGEAIARRDQGGVRDEVGLTVSVGVASTKLVAKIASDLRKPDGLVVVPPGTRRPSWRRCPSRGCGASARRRRGPGGLRRQHDRRPRRARPTSSSGGSASTAARWSRARGLDPDPVHGRPGEVGRARAHVRRRHARPRKSSSGRSWRWLTGSRAGCVPPA